MNKRRVKTPGRFADEEKWYIVQFSMDNEFSFPLTGSQIEDSQTGESAADKLFSVGDDVEGEWSDGIQYGGKVVFESETKEACMRFRSTCKKQKKVTKRKPAGETTEPKKGETAAKKKKENAEKRKREEAVKQTAVEHAQQLFAESLHEHVSNSINNSSETPILTNSNSGQLSLSNINKNPTACQFMTSPPVSHAQSKMSYNSNNSQSHSHDHDDQSNNATQPSPNLNIPVQVPQTRNNQYNYLTSRSNDTANLPFSVNSYSNLQSPALVTPASSHQTNFSQVSYTAKPLEPLMPLIAPGYESVNTELCSSSDLSQNLYCGPYPPLLPIPNPYQTTFNNSNQFSNTPMSNSMDFPPNSLTSTSQQQDPLTSNNGLMNLSGTTFCKSPSTSSSSLATNLHVSRPQICTSTITRPTSSTNTSAGNSCNLSSFLSTSLDCGECILKEAQIESLTNYQKKLESDVLHWKNQATQLQAELERNLETGRQGSQEGKDSSHYTPKRGISIDKCNYIFCGTGDDVPQGYVRLVEGHDLFVPVKWMNDIQGHFRGKTKAHGFKLLLNGFYEPIELKKVSAMTILSTQLGKALKAYGVVIMGMDSVSITKAINTKIGTVARAFKFGRI